MIDTSWKRFKNDEARDAAGALERAYRAVYGDLQFNSLTQALAGPILQLINEGIQRLRDRCPELLGVDLGCDERCHCAMCDYSDPFADDNDNACECGCQGEDNG